MKGRSNDEDEGSSEKGSSERSTQRSSQWEARQDGMWTCSENEGRPLTPSSVQSVKTFSEPSERSWNGTESLGKKQFEDVQGDQMEEES